MPANTKARARIIDKQVIYVSWFDEEDLHRPWIELFWRKATGPAETFRCVLGRTDPDRTAGSIRDYQDMIDKVTDLVAVLTDTYLIANRDAKSDLKRRELARFIELRKKEGDDDSGKRAWLAPLESCTYKHYRFGDIWLSEDKFWLVRRKPDGEVYPTPPDRASDKEAWALVNEIISATEGDDETETTSLPLWKKLKQLLPGASN